MSGALRSRAARRRPHRPSPVRERAILGAASDHLPAKPSPSSASRKASSSPTSNPPNHARRTPHRCRQHQARGVRGAEQKGADALSNTRAPQPRSDYTCGSESVFPTIVRPSARQSHHGKRVRGLPGAALTTTSVRQAARKPSRGRPQQARPCPAAQDRRSSTPEPPRRN